MPPPTQYLRTLPSNAVIDDGLNQKLVQYCSDLPKKLGSLARELARVSTDSRYDATMNVVTQAIWPHLPRLLNLQDHRYHFEFYTFARDHLILQLAAKITRRLVRSSSRWVRELIARDLTRESLDEVTLPTDSSSPWDAKAWLIPRADLRRHPTGREVQERQGLPGLTTVAELRELLGIRSRKLLRYLFLATDDRGGPYTAFSIPKRDGSSRVIHAPKPLLKSVQRRIQELILSKVPTHDAAHGFVPGRSTVTNAAPHLGSELILKFDLHDFFPSIHYFRVLGLFASLGYYVGNGRFHSGDTSRRVGSVLARLCCHTPTKNEWRSTVTPQGAPTSPAISNLVCRRLDSRLAGLAIRFGGLYTRYVDDLTFSFRDAANVDIGRFRWWVDQICHQEGFLVHQKKFRAIRRCRRQEVTGIVVNDELHVPRDVRRQFRAILHNCRKHGVASQARDKPNFRAYLRGMASYIHMVQPDEGVELLREVEELLGKEPRSD